MAAVKSYRVIGPVAVIRKDGHERYVSKGGTFTADQIDEANAEHLLGVNLIEAIESAGGDEPAFPEGGPSEEWTVKQLDAYAAKHGVDVSAAKNKPEKVALLTQTA